MPEFILGNRTISLRPSDVIGKGGEADIFRKGSEAFKVFKPPTHPDVSHSPQLMAEAKARIAEHQLKLPAFPKGLPSRVSSPGELLRDKGGMIAGYQMNFVDNVEVLYSYGERAFREQGISDDTVRGIFIDLFKTVEAVHKAGVVIGDFNDLNVLIRNTDAHIIDADSMQFGKFPARMFTGTFVDPRICDPNATSPMMIGKHSPETDWYAYVIMLMRSLLYVGPYGGVYRPADKQKNLPHDARPLKRLTVFDPEVKYPKPARPYNILPDDLLNYFNQVFVKDKRGTPALSLIENLRFTTCTKCGAVHARGQCPTCVGVTPVMLKEVHLGNAKGTKLFETGGRILYAAMQQGSLRYLYHEQDAYRREGGRVVVKAKLDPNMRFRIQGGNTLIAQGTQCLIFPFESSTPLRLAVDTYGMLPLIDANADSFFFAEGGGLYRSSEHGLDMRDKIGDVLSNQTLFWVGDTLGFGFYRAAELSNFFMFRPKHLGLNDSVALPPIRGQLVDSTAVFGSDRVWFFTTTQEGSKAINRCHCVNAQGKLLGSAEAAPGDGSWLGVIRGSVAASDFLLVPTDDGVVRVALSGNSLDVAKTFPDTHRFVDSNSLLFLDKQGLVVKGNREIWRLVIT